MHPIAHAGDVAEGAARGGFGFLRTHPLRHQLLPATLEMVGDFRAQLVVEPAASEKGHRTTPPYRCTHHSLLSAITGSMFAARRAGSQAAAAAASIRKPAVPANDNGSNGLTP